jgi:thiol-disulfide isomerase/thioredoxin
LKRLARPLVSTTRRGPHPWPGRLRRLIRIESAAHAAASTVQKSGRSRSMRRLFILFLAAGAFVWAWTDFTPKPSRRPGQIVPDFALIDARTGQINRLAEHKGSVVVIVFVGTSCPVGDLYMPRLCELSRQYEMHNVNFLAINSMRARRWRTWPIMPGGRRPRFLS